MASIIPVERQKEKKGGEGITFRRVLGDIVPVAALGAATVATGGAATPAAKAGLLAAGVNAAGHFLPRHKSGGASQEPEQTTSMLNAAGRRSQYLQEDPTAAIANARLALGRSGLDERTRAILEAPLIRAQQRRGS